MTPEYVTCANIVIDDIVLADGHSWMNILGGAGTHALCGMRIWSDQLGYVASVGEDFDPQHRAELLALGVDLSGVKVCPEYQTARCWQIFEWNERRTEIFRTSEEAFYRLTPRFEDIPPAYLAAKGFHMLSSTMSELLALIERLQAANPNLYLAWEPSPLQLTATPEEMQAALPRVTVFSPNQGDAQTITGTATPEQAVEKLLHWGAPIVALRMGAEGSMIATASGERYHIPAVPPNAIVDMTGAGNAYVGGLLVGLSRGLSPVEAGAYGAVSASFALEQFGLIRISPELQTKSAHRLAWAQSRIEQIA